MIARVAAVYGDECDIITPEGLFRAETCGALRFSASSPADLPVTGDWVDARLLEPGRALIHAVQPRGSLISRGAAGRRHDEQGGAFAPRDEHIEYGQIKRDFRHSCDAVRGL